MTSNIHKVDISHKTVFFIAAFLALIWALFLIKDVIILLFVAIIFMSALSPIVNSLVKIKIPKSLAIAITYIIIFSILGLIISFVVAPLVEQTATLVTNLPQYTAVLLPESGPIDRTVLQQELGNFSKNALEFSLAIFSNFLAFISVAVLTFYLLLEGINLIN
jgi:predicted PurR-regulated permease PerM